MDEKELQRKVDESIGEIASDESNDINREDIAVGDPMTVSEFVDMVSKIKDNREKE